MIVWCVILNTMNNVVMSHELKEPPNIVFVTTLFMIKLTIPYTRKQTTHPQKRKKRRKNKVHGNLMCTHAIFQPKVHVISIPIVHENGIEESRMITSMT